MMAWSGNLHRGWRVLALVMGLVAQPCPAQAPWSTYRGNPQRTACTDGKAGPATPAVLWTWQSKDHFVASPVPAGDRLYVSGLGAFNVATFSSLATGPTEKTRVVWSRSAPYLKLPTVCSPALLSDRLVFGDGMHQTEGALLHCLEQKQGLPLWQLPVTGSLTHLEGGPTISEGRVYIGGGSAGLLAVDLDQVTLEGKELKLSEIQKVLETRWQQLLVKYEEQKKKDPDFAVPPSEDQLPRARPRLLWKQGEGKWHVDAPVAAVTGKVLVGSAYLDREKTGDRALYCLEAGSGKTLWRAPLDLNPWGGPSVQGNRVIVGGSSIGYYPKLLRGARGLVACFDLATGKELWKKPVQGGVVSSVALTDKVAVATATDGKVRAFDLENGQRKWIHDARMPFFAPPAIAGDMVYVADLAGTLHALQLETGLSRWTFNTGKLPEPAPGMFYAGPIVHQGRIYAATCNLDGLHVGKQTVVFCLGEK